jgi:hypothetical protein
VTSLDLAGLVLVAGRALDLEEAAVLGLADLEAAASVLAAARNPAGGPERQAAILVHGLVRRQVFGPRSSSWPCTGWPPSTWGRRGPFATCWPAWPAAGSASTS